MADIQHAALDYTENHVAHAYEYANTAQREGAAGFVAGDIGKLALQTDDKSLWMLTTTAPLWAAAILTGTITVDTIAEDTPGAGVTIDGVLCKDSAVTASSGFTGDLTGDVTGDVTGALTGNADTATTATNQSGGTVAATTGSFSGQVTSTIATGTAPLVVASTTKVANLNADLLDDLSSAAFALTAHTHGQSTINASAIGQGELKTATGTVSTISSSGANLTLPGGEYGFYPRVWVEDFSTTGTVQIALSIGSMTAVTNIHLDSTPGGVGETVYASQRYIQSSPPYMLGDSNWGHFVYQLRNKSTKEVISTYESQDPPWAYNGPSWLHKNDPELIALIPHPFPDFGTALLPEADFEIVLIDLRDTDVDRWLRDNERKGKTITKNFNELASVGKTKTRQQVGIPEILGFTDKIKIKARN